MRIQEVTHYLETIAPLAYQESYDNAGLILGDPNAEVSKALVCLDAVESVVDEAIEQGCNLIIAHHPIVFSGLRKLNGKNYIERTVIKAIKNDIAIYAIHTNLDNVLNGVNKKIAEKLGLQNLSILSPKSDLLKKLITFVPVDDAEKVRLALFAAGAGHIGDYSEASYNSKGFGTFKGNDNTNPHVGVRGVRHEEEELKVETLFPGHIQAKVVAALLEAHPYEEVAYDIIPLENQHQGIGSGMIGDLADPLALEDLLTQLKEKMQTDCIRHTADIGKSIQKVAICGGSGSFLLPVAMAQGADILITGDFKYHQFFDADNRIVIADIGHYESEQFTSELLYDLLSEKFSNFAVQISTINTNPINYF